MNEIPPRQLAAEPEPSAEASAEGLQEQSDPEGPRDLEKRGYLRHAFSASAVVIETRSRTRLVGRATDLSFGGCYLDAISPFPLGALVRLQLTAGHRTLQSEARVTYSLPGMGMGLAFMNMPPEQAAALHDWICELSGEAPAGTSLESDFSFAGEAPAVKAQPALPQHVLDELVTLLYRKGVLSRAEVDVLRNKMSH